MPGFGKTANAPGSSSYATKLGGVRILIVISSEQAAQLVKKLLQSLGFRKLFIAYDAAQAVAMLREEDPMHFIVTDADLKVSRGDDEQNSVSLSGLQFVHRLRSSPSSPAPFVPVLMMMDHARSADILEARDVGVTEVILKPLDAKNFCQRILDLIDNPRPHVTFAQLQGSVPPPQ